MSVKELLFPICAVYIRGAGYVNTNGLNNAGNEGRYWSSSPNSDGTNAYNLNFWSGNLYPSNNNNRYNGYSVRCLACSNPEINYTSNIW